MIKKKLTTWEVLRLKFPENEYVLIEEVSDASGFNRSRSLDFMLINLWNSRGLAVTGIERKSNRGDWLKEIKQPEKQENHFKYCDYFYLLTDKEGVAKIEEIPTTWGWYHINENRVLKTMKAAPKLNPLTIERSLLCAMLRRAADKTGFVRADSLESHIEVRAEKIRIDRNFALESKSRSYDDLKKRVDEFEAASGIKISRQWYGDPKKMGEAVRVIMNNETGSYIKRLQQIGFQIKNIHEGIERSLLVLNSEQNVQALNNENENR